jgi:hypothetical protein
MVQESSTPTRRPIERSGPKFAVIDREPEYRRRLRGERPRRDKEIRPTAFTRKGVLFVRSTLTRSSVLVSRAAAKMFSSALLSMIYKARALEESLSNVNSIANDLLGLMQSAAKLVELRRDQAASG